MRSAPLPPRQPAFPQRKLLRTLFISATHRTISFSPKRINQRFTNSFRSAKTPVQYKFNVPLLKIHTVQLFPNCIILQVYGGSRSGAPEDYFLLGYDVAAMDNLNLTFRGNVMFSRSTDCISRKNTADQDVSTIVKVRTLSCLEMSVPDQVFQMVHYSGPWN